MLGAYVAGVGVNAVVPVRGGDVLRLYLAHRAVPGSTYTTLASTYVVMGITDAALALVFFAYALTLGVLPGISLLPDLRSFDFVWLLTHPRATGGILFALVVAGLALAIWLRPRIDDFRGRFSQAFAVLRTPTRYLRTVVAWQLADWGLRLATIWFFLAAFGVDQSARNVMLVQVTHSLATLVPISPGGIGTEQAFLVYVFQGKAGAALAFSVGGRIILTAVKRGGRGRAAPDVAHAPLQAVRGGCTTIYRGHDRLDLVDFERVGIRAGARLGLRERDDDMTTIRQPRRYLRGQEDRVGASVAGYGVASTQMKLRSTGSLVATSVAMSGVPSDFNSGSGVTGLNVAEPASSIRNSPFSFRNGTAYAPCTVSPPAVTSPLIAAIDHVSDRRFAITRSLPPWVRAIAPRTTPRVLPALRAKASGVGPYLAGACGEQLEHRLVVPAPGRLDEGVEHVRGLVVVGEVELGRNLLHGGRPRRPTAVLAATRKRQREQQGEQQNGSGHDRCLRSCAAGRTKCGPCGPEVPAPPRAPPARPRRSARPNRNVAGSPDVAQDRRRAACRRSLERLRVAAAPVVGERESMRLVADPLGAAGRGRACRARPVWRAPARTPPLASPARRRRREEGRTGVDRLQGGRELTAAAVDDNQVRHRRQLRPTRPVTPRPAAARAAGNDLRHRGEIVLSLLPADREGAVVRFLRGCVLEYHH